MRNKITTTFSFSLGNYILSAFCKRSIMNLVLRNIISPESWSGELGMDNGKKKVWFVQTSKSLMFIKYQNLLNITMK